MESERIPAPDRRDFVRNLGGAAVYGVPIFAVLGATQDRRESGSNPELIARHLQEAARHLNEAYRLGARYRFTDRDWDVMAPAVKGITPPIKNWPPDWCAIC